MQDEKAYTSYKDLLVDQELTLLWLITFIDDHDDLFSFDDDSTENAIDPKDEDGNPSDAYGNNFSSCEQYSHLRIVHTLSHLKNLAPDADSILKKTKVQNQQKRDASINENLETL